MERCVFCQAPLPEGATTCPTCGQKQPATDYIPPEGNTPDFVPPFEAPTAPYVYHEFPIDYQEPSPPLASGPTWAFTAPGASLAAPSPAAVPTASPPPRKSRRKLLALLLVALIVLGAGGTTAFILTRPAPVITLTGPQQSNALPAGSPDLAFHVAGSDFSTQSAITFLLDGKSAPGAPEVSSDQHGAFAIDLPITDDWLFGQHTLTAKDAQGYVTKTGARLLVLAAPVSSVTSSYAQGSVPAGANGTTLAYAGKRFALNSPIALRLNGKPLESASPITSDERERIAGTISIDATFALGSYTLTAQDAQGNVTQTAASFVIVTQGEAGTPGPHGAPADDLSFGAYVRVSAKTTSGQSFSFTQILTVTGNPDPAGGSVCSDQDNGQPRTFTGKLTGSSETFTETITFACRGTYKHGHLTYVEIDTSDKFVLGSGVRCASRGPYIYGAYDGSFTSATTMRGVYVSDYFQANCTDGSFIFRNSASGTWTGGT